MHTVHFRKILSVIWPIHRHELKKVLPMLVMFFCIAFNYNALHCIKDPMLISASAMRGAEILPYIKFWGVTPLAIIFTICYAKLSNVFTKQTLFYGSILTFAAFFLIFCFFLYPNSESLHPKFLQVPFLPKGFTEVLRLWTFSLFYIFSELWGSVALSLLFWQFANQINNVSEAKRCYSLFGVGTIASLEISGRMIALLDCWGAERGYNAASGFSFTLNVITALIIVSIGIILGIYWWMNKYIVTDNLVYDHLTPSGKVAIKKDKLKLSLRESLQMVFKSKYLMCIAILVICYGICINFTEVTWKSLLKDQYPTNSEYLLFLGKLNQYVARATLIMVIFFSGNILRKFGWTIAALVTPVSMLVLGLCFFNVVICKDKIVTLLTWLNIGSSALAIKIGLLQNMASKACKYSIFDQTKEMLYIPLDEEAKIKGKAAIDVVGARLGKAGASVIQQVLFSFAPLMALLPQIETLFMTMILLWIAAIWKLGKEFRKNELAAETVEQLTL